MIISKTMIVFLITSEICPSHPQQKQILHCFFKLPVQKAEEILNENGIEDISDLDSMTQNEIKELSEEFSKILKPGFRSKLRKAMQALGKKPDLPSLSTSLLNSERITIFLIFL